MLQAKAVSIDIEDIKKPTSPDVESQSENGHLDKAKHSGDGFGVLSARTGSWHLDAAEDRYKT